MIQYSCEEYPVFTDHTRLDTEWASNLSIFQQSHCGEQCHVCEAADMFGTFATSIILYCQILSLYM